MRLKGWALVNYDVFGNPASAYFNSTLLNVEDALRYFKENFFFDAPTSKILEGQFLTNKELETETLNPKNCSHTCQVCDRESPEPVTSRQFLTGSEVYMCKTCWAIWYDGVSDTQEIKRHSLYWPVNDLSAYAKASYD